MDVIVLVSAHSNGVVTGSVVFWQLVGWTLCNLHDL